MKIIHIVPHINAEGSGPSYSVPRLCQAIAGRGHDLTLSCLAAAHDVQGITLELHPSWCIMKRFAVSHHHALALSRAAKDLNIVHNHSLWSMMNVAAGWIVPGKHAKLIVSPRGTLSRWALAHNKRLKQMLWPLQKRVLMRADLLHATSTEEYEDIRRAGVKAPVLVAPNGIDLPTLQERRPLEDTRTLLFLSRIHPVKGIENLLDAWAGLEERHSNWRLRIAGPGDARYIAELKERACTNGSRRVDFDSALYGADKADAYRNADLFVLPTHSENFGMVIAEALAQECPVVVSHGAPWSKLNAEGCGWWVPNDSSSMHSTLDVAMSLPRIELQSMGVKGRMWMERDFSWASAAQAMEAGYLWLLEGGTPPDCVRIA